MTESSKVHPYTGNSASPCRAVVSPMAPKEEIVFHLNEGPTFLPSELTGSEGQVVKSRPLHRSSLGEGRGMDSCMCSRRG